MADTPPESEIPSIPTLELVDGDSPALRKEGAGSIDLLPPIEIEGAESPAPTVVMSTPSPAPTAAYVEEEKTDPGIDVPPAPKKATAPAPIAAKPVLASKPAPTRLLRPVPTPTPALVAATAAMRATPPPAASQAVPTPITERRRMPNLGILNELMRDLSITEIMVNDTRNIMVERAGILTQAPRPVATLEELNQIVRAILDVTGRVLTPEQPFADSFLPDGSRVNIVTAPLVLRGPCITIRKFPARGMSLEELMQKGSLDKRAAYFLSACVIGKANLVICGSTGSGKTTLLNALAAYIPRTERIVSIEDTPELRIGHPNSVQMQTKPSTPGAVAISARELVANALRMRPDRLIVGECRRAEALDMLQAMNTGHNGSMTTVHANSPRDALSRLETLCLMAGLDLPLTAIRRQMESAIDLVVQIGRTRDGSRKILAIAEITGMEGDIITMQDIFIRDAAGVLKCTGYVPLFASVLTERGVNLPANYFA